MNTSTSQMCKRCVLTTAVPRIALDAEGVCNVCREYDARKTQYDLYFKTEGDLTALLNSSHRPEAPYDVLAMYSGGKDSTYLLCRLVEMNQRVLALTFDNGYVPQQCFDNIQAVCTSLGVQSVVVSVQKEKMDEVFALSLKRQNTVCSGCFRALTARGTELAVEKGIPVVMTGLSRGQIFHTKVHPLLSNGITDPNQIDENLNMFREMYHSAKDRIATLVDDRALLNRKAFQDTRFVDFFRYVSVTKKSIFDLICERVPAWKLPENVGACSSNCLINDVGIQVHLERTGYHNYAIPVSWDIRFGHITRDAAVEELDSELDTSKVRGILKAIGL